MTNNAPMLEDNCSPIDRAAAVLTSKLHQGDGGREARDILAFEANTMGRSDFKAMVEQVRTNEALSVNDLMRNGQHNEAINRLREDANIFGNGEDFVELAGQIRQMNKRTQSPSHLEFEPIYQNGDQYGRPSANEIKVKTTFQRPTGEQYELEGVVARVDNQRPQDAVFVAPPVREVVVIQAPPPPPQVIIDGRVGVGGRRGNEVGIGIGIGNGDFQFNFELELGRERMRRHDPHWCPDNNWRPRNAPPDFRLDVEINRTREEYRRRGDHNWNPRRETPRTIINQINNTTIINNVDNSVNNSNNRTRTTENSNNTTRTEDNSRTRSKETTVNRPLPPSQEAPNRNQQERNRGDNQPPQHRRPEPPVSERPQQQERTPPQRREQRDNNAEARQREAAERRQRAQEQAEKNREQHEKDKANKKR